jgi:hypothetical protein
MKVTKESLINAEACYDEERINALPIPPNGATPRQVAEYDIIPIEDRLWALCCAIICSSEQEAAHYERQLLLFAIYCAEDATNNEIAAGRQPYKDSLRAIEITKKFLNGEATLEELRIAMEKAYNAAYAANCEAYYAVYYVASAAYHATCYVALAAYNAAYAAYEAYNAAYYAANASYYAADKDPVLLQKYLDKLVNCLS